MKKTQITRLLSLLVCVVLIAAMALFACGCDNKSDESKGKFDSTSDATDEFSTEAIRLDDGKTAFNFKAVDIEGTERDYFVVTKKSTVGEALLETGLIVGEDGDYGLYVKTVDGVTLDYDKDGKYWAFYINGEYAMTGVDRTDIVAGYTYTFKAEK